jgi:protein involved in polysaccharide export with SLBB domain
VKQLRDGDTVMVPPIGPQVKVEGMVRRPAVYELRSATPLAEVLELAGGILPTATLRNIQVQRLEAHEKRTMISVDLPESGDSEAVRAQLQSFAVREGDEIRIYPIAQHNLEAVYLLGHALRPGRYSYRQGMRVTDLISSYKDLLPEPAPKYAEIVRLNAPDFRPSVESFDLGAALANPASAPALQPMDTVRVFSRYDFEEAPTVWVGGEVFEPGTYGTSGQIHLRDAVHLAGGLTPDAKLDSAQVFRNLPGGEMKIFSVTLSEALAGNPIDNVLLEPRDRVLIHRSLAKVDPPTVYIKGEVAKPGRYPLTGNMRIADLIGVAGGLKRSAFTDMADLTRYLTEGQAQTTGEHQEISLAAALAGDTNSNQLLRDGDTLSIRQIPGWKDIGASIVVEGEVQHPGTYGISPGETLSSVLRRAGGFLPTAYPRGAVYERIEVRKFQEKTKEDLIRRIDQEGVNVKVALTENAQEQAALQQAALVQKERVLTALRQAPVTGRMVVRLTDDLSQFTGSPDDIEVRAGDRLVIPKNPNVVIVTGQVYNPNALTFRPRKGAGWYLERAGGPSALAEKKNIFIVRANGEVVSGNNGSWWGGGVLSTKVEPGDTIVVPEKAIGGSTFWKNFVAIAQVASSAAIGYAVATR